MSGPVGNRVGFVAIGRNEGERLRRCLTALRGMGVPVVYVDSGSTDGSVEFARGTGAFVVELDTGGGFTMARGRNAGWRALRGQFPEVELVHFIDGDCEIIPGWLDEAVRFLDAQPQAAVVCGRRCERFPARSVYNRLMDIEWNTPAGEARSCGGDALMRLALVEKAGGFNEVLIAGEEPELCQRLRGEGWKIWRLPHDMTLHDAAMTSFGQWWKRHVRGGYGAMDVALRLAAAGLTGRDVLFAEQVRSARRWVGGTVLVLVVGIVAAPVTGMSWMVPVTCLALAAVWGLQAARIAWGIRRRAASPGAAVAYGFFTMLAKWPQVMGQRKYAADRRAGRTAQIIEYKQ